MQTHQNLLQSESRKMLVPNRLAAYDEHRRQKNLWHGLTLCHRTVGKRLPTLVPSWLSLARSFANQAPSACPRLRTQTPRTVCLNPPGRLLVTSKRTSRSIQLPGRKNQTFIVASKGRSAKGCRLKFSVISGVPIVRGGGYPAAGH